MVNVWQEESVTLLKLLKTSLKWWLIHQLHSSLEKHQHPPPRKKKCILKENSLRRWGGKGCVGRLNQTQTICKADNIRNKEEMLKMNMGVRWENIHRRSKTIYHCLRKNKRQAKRIKIALFTVLAKRDYFKKSLEHQSRKTPAHRPRIHYQDLEKHVGQSSWTEQLQMNSTGDSITGKCKHK